MRVYVLGLESISRSVLAEGSSVPQCGESPLIGLDCQGEMLTGSPMKDGRPAVQCEIAPDDHMRGHTVKGQKTRMASCSSHRRLDACRLDRQTRHTFNSF
jgi:hypothetical protein